VDALLYFLIPGMPLLAFLLIAVFARRGEGEQAAPIFIITALLISLGLSLRALQVCGIHDASGTTFTWLQVGELTFRFGVLIDPLSSVMMVVVCTVSLLVQIYSIGYMKGETGYGRYFAYMSLFSGSMLGLVISPDLVQTYIFWELVGICSYFLIGFWYRRPSAAAAAKKAFVVTRFGDLGFLVGLLILAAQPHPQFGFGELHSMLHSRHNALSTGVVTAVALLIFSGAVGKSAQFPLHIWLPDAMEGPTPVSALIHAATMVAAGVYLVARTYFLFLAAPVALFVVAVIGAITLFLAATMGVAENDIKRVMAYSTVSQLGYMMLALGLGGYVAGVLHLTTHAFFKALLFLTAGSVIHAVHTNDMWQMGGLRKRMPVTAITCLLGALALAGVFPFSGFWSKDEILAAAVHSTTSGHWVFFAVALFAAFLTAFYVFRLWFLTFWGESRSEAARHAHESPPVMTGPLVILGTLAVIAGGLVLLVPGTGLSFDHYLGHGLHYPAMPEEPSYFVMGLSTLAALAGIALAWAAYVKGSVSSAAFNRRFPAVYALLKNAWYLNRAWELFATRVVLAGSGLAAWFDRHVVDGMVNGVAWLCGRAGDRLRLLQTGQMQFYAVVLVLGVIASLLVFAARDSAWLTAWVR
jgi:NADH-quinone oxidoreductase subunit L